MVNGTDRRGSTANFNVMQKKKQKGRPEAGLLASTDRLKKTRKDDQVIE